MYDESIALEIASAYRLPQTKGWEKMFRKMRTIFAKYGSEDLAEQIVECLKEDVVVNVLYMQYELVEELNDLPYITPIKKGQSQVKLGV